ncbi:MAG: hypothetical protein HC908_08200 [Calothrix sp. SM1_7_51]|nr:hypothetical protein [Calothrix sp. SM1_7_51]
MITNETPSNPEESSSKPPGSKEFVANLKNGIWLFGISSWIFGITDRSIACFSDGYLSATDLVQLFTAGVFFIAWLFLKPQSTKV